MIPAAVLPFLDFFLGAVLFAALCWPEPQKPRRVIPQVVHWSELE